MIASRRELLLALGVFVALALILGWPLPARMGREIPVGETPRDAMHLLYALTWSAQSLGDNPFHLFNATLFYPHHTPIAFLDHMVGLAAIVAPINWASGSMTGGFNSAWLLTFALSGLGAYLLARYLGASAPGAALAGLLYAWFPLRMANSGHVNVLAMMWIPFALMSLHLWVETRLRRELFLFLAFGLLQFLSSAYSGVFLVVMAGLYLAVLLVVERRDTLQLLGAQRWVILTVVVLGVTASLPLVMPYLWASRADVGYQLSLEETAAYSAGVLDLVTPAPGTPLHGMTPWRDASRYAAFPGVLATLLLAYWLYRRGWRRDAVHRGELIFYLALIPVSMLLGLGPRLGGPEGRIPLPFSAAYYLLPGGSFIREPARFLLLGSLSTGLLAGLGLTLLLERAARAPALRFAATLLPVLAAVELYPGPPKLMNPLPGGIPPVYAWLGSVEGELAIVELPMPLNRGAETVETARYQLYSLVHGKRIVNGVAAVAPPLTRDLRREMQSFPSSGSISRLREIGVTYVLIHTEAYAPEALTRMEEELRTASGVNAVDMQGPIWVLDVVPQSAGGSRDPTS